MKFLTKTKYFAKRIGKKIEAKSPEILLGVGIVTGVGAIVLTAIQTLKIGDVLDKHEEEMAKIDEKIEKSGTTEIEIDEKGNAFTILHENFTEKDAGKARMGVYLKTLWGFTKLYAPVFGLSMVSFASFGGSYKVLKDRNLALSAAYSSLFKEGCDKLTGKEEESQEKTEEKPKDTPKRATYIYSRDTSGVFYNSEAMNIDTLKMAEEYFTQLLRGRGYVFLGEVFKELRMPYVPEGQVVGWCLKKGDNYVSLRAKPYEVELDPTDKAKSPFGLSKETYWVLDPNTCGIMYDLV